MRDVKPYSPLACVAFATLLLLSGPSFAQNAQSDMAAPDNSAINQRDRNPSEVTADQAQNNAGDLDKMKSIRQAVLNDASLSTYAHNIKIVAQGGKVTLKGPVKSQDEINLIQTKAIDVAGAGNVVNELSVVK